jgi:uncharacterized protein (DUF433 family)
MYYTVLVASSVPFSVRLPKELDEVVTAEARRTKRSKGSVLVGLAEEAYRMRRFPGIGFIGDDWDRRAWVMGSGWDVWEVIQGVQAFGSAEALAQEYDAMTAELVALAEAYYHAYSDEIDSLIADNRRPLEAIARENPMFEVLTRD